MLASSVIIRVARPQDAEDLALVHEQSWRSTYQGILPHLALERQIAARSTQWWKRVLTKSRDILILKIEGEPAGYCSAGRSTLGSHPNAMSARKGAAFKGEIFELYLKPEYQGLGFGSRFFDAARETLISRGIAPGLVVWSLSDNEQACAFYRAKGGRDLGQVKDCFGGVSVMKSGFGWS